MDEVKMGFKWSNGQDRGDRWRAFHSRSKAHGWPGLVEAMAGRSEDQRWHEGSAEAVEVARQEGILRDFWCRSG